MSNRSKSLFRGPNVKHFALVHRSLRDPLINDPESSDRVLAEVHKGKGRTRADLESSLGEQKLSGVRSNEGEAATYGIYYDDSEYDYMQHLRGVGEGGGDGSSTLVEAPRRNDVKGKGRAVIALRDAAENEEEQTYKDYLESTIDEGGLQPDMDPALREVLEALDDEAYVDDDGNSDAEGGDLFDSLLHGKGDYREPSQSQSGGAAKASVDSASTFEDQVRGSKAAKGEDSDDDFSDDGDEDDLASEGGDTIAELRAASMRRPPRQHMSDRRSVASGSAFSMSSSSMFRNDGLRTLDDRFDQVEALYEEDSESEEDEEPDDIPSSLQDIMDDFLSTYEIHGGRMDAIPGGTSATGKDQLDMLRKEMSRLHVLEAAKRHQEEDAARKGRPEEEEIWTEASSGADKGNKWDVETILSTYSNLENHPRVLRLQSSLNAKSKRKGKEEPASKITIDPKTGFPVVLAPTDRNAQRPLSGRNGDGSDDDDDDGGDSDATMDAEEMNGHKRQTVARSRTETPAEKKARKAAVKEERQARRVEKKTTKESFGQERKRQQKVRQGKLRDAADVSKGNSMGIDVIRLS